MSVRLPFRCLFVVLNLQSFALFSAAGDANPRIDYNREVRTILSNNCYKCHGPDADERQAELRFDLREEAIEPAESGTPAIVPGDPEASGLVKRIFSSKPGLVMPPPKSLKTLTSVEKQLLKDWVAQGAAYQTHWSFQPIRRPALPSLKNPVWPRNPIDAFILARLEKEGLRPAIEADRPTLIRRLALDLTGLPPTPAQVDKFVADTRPDAYERVVEHFLNSPHFGERMTLDWLDAARYADTHGYHIDSGRDMTRWREWVINAFNANLGFDRFTIDQIAGDLLPDATLEQKIASGFNRNHMITFEGGAIPEEYQTAYILDRVNTTGTVWLGLTVACTQCHDHKYDPISQKDYYSLYAFFNNVPEKGIDGSKGNASPMIRLPSPAQQSTIDHLKNLVQDLNRDVKKIEDIASGIRRIDAETSKYIAELEKDQNLPKELKNEFLTEYRGQLSHPKKHSLILEKATRTYKDQLAIINKDLDNVQNRVPTAMVMEEMAKPRETFTLIRGQYDKQGEKVLPGVPSFLPPIPSGVKADRLALARWLVDPAHPLVGRVTVNRFWQTFFGTGIVKTSEDFGSQGEAPTHPGLLDWLASEFIFGSNRSKPWDVKALVRLILTSATYRQRSFATPELIAHDPENRLLARGPRIRLPAEFIRDQALAVSGLLNGEIGGASVSPYQPTGLWEELMSRSDSKNWSAQTYVQSHGKDLYRRTMYTFWKRTSPPPSLSTFDAPDREVCTVRRARTNTPLQALVLMNDPTYVEAARKLAERMMTEGGTTAQSRIAFAFRVATSRKPSDTESRILRDVFETDLAKYRQNVDSARKLLSVGDSPRRESLDLAEHAAWTTVASVILNLDEVLNKN